MLCFLVSIDITRETYFEIWFFRCSAHNEYLKDPKHIQYTLEVTNSITTNNAMLLPALQNQAIFVANGNALNLYCAPTSIATSKGNAIRWTFISRSATSSPAGDLNRNPNKLHIANTSVEQNDGIYKCQFGDEYQVRQKDGNNVKNCLFLLLN